jgi:uncharacterized membrane protein YphA (DoxX/SURF4 family)
VSISATNQASSQLGAASRTEARATNVTLWVIQGLLGALFVFAGVMKFVMSVEEMTKEMPMPGAFLHFIGVAELLGGLGLVLPGLLKIKRGLTPLAALGLTIIMVGAVVVTAPKGVAGAAMPFVVCLLVAFVAFKRWHWLKNG